MLVDWDSFPPLVQSSFFSYVFPLVPTSLGGMVFFPSVSGFIPSLGLEEQVYSGSFIVAENHGGFQRKWGLLEAILVGKIPSSGLVFLPSGILYIGGFAEGSVPSLFL